MKIMIVGIGGVGGYIAGMVGQKYKNLTLIARGKRGEALREHGVVLHSDFHGEKRWCDTGVCEGSGGDSGPDFSLC